MQKKLKIPTIIVYTLLAFGVIRQVWGLVQTLGPDRGFPHVNSIKVAVSGDVRQPGVYRVPEATTQFEVLQAAGYRLTSDLSNINLLASAGGNLAVPGRDQEVGIASPQAAPRIESQSGDVTVIARDGSRRLGQEGAIVNVGDTLRTLASAKMELSIVPLFQLSLEEFSELTLDTIRFSNGSATGAKIAQRNGTGWYRVGRSSGGYWQVATPSATVTAAGNGAEFLVEVQIDRASISCTGGSLTAEKAGGGESVNLIAGQAAVIYKDNRPFQLTHSNAGLDVSHQFTRAASGNEVGNPENEQQSNFLFCGTPYLYLVIRFHPGKDVVSIIHIPPQLLVSQYAPGVSTLDQAFLYGGPAFVSSILERLLNTRLTKYCAASKASVLQVAEVLGGISIENGSKLSGRELVQYLAPSSSSLEQSLVRQQQVFNAVFDNVKNKNLVVTLPTLQQMLGAMQTNLDPKELMEQYTRIAAKGDWTRRDVKLPVQETHQNGKVLFQPDFEQCRALFNE